MSCPSPQPLPMGGYLVDDPRPRSAESPDNLRGDLIVSQNMKIANNKGRIYILVNKLGAGSVSSVYEALTEDEGTGQTYSFAMKISKSTKDAILGSRIEIENLINIRKLLPIEKRTKFALIRDTFSFKGHICIVEDIVGGNLLSIIHENNYRGIRLSVIQLIASEALQRLADLHSIGVVHTDIKPENIAQEYDNSLHIKLLDFGNTIPIQMLGTEYKQSRYYRAPEVALRMNASAKIDIWSLGITLCELHIGLPIFPAVSELHLVTMINDFLGPFPSKMIDASPVKAKYFSEDYSMKEADLLCSENPDQSFQGFKSYFVSDSFDRIMLSYPLPKNYSEEREALEMERRQIFLDLLHSLLTLDPDERPTAKDALNHPFFRLNIPI